MWTKQDRVLCMMSSPDYNQTFIKELIINKLYEVGQLDENQKNNSYDNI